MNDFGGIKTDIPGILIDADMFLRSDLVSSSASPRLNVRGQVLLESGRQNEFTFEIPAGVAYTAQVNFFKLPRGILLNASIVNPSGSGIRGQDYVQLSIQKSTLSSVRPFRILTNGYISDRIGLNWPPGSFELPGTGRGIIIGTPISNPSAGASLEINTQGATRWRLLCVSFLLTTSVGAGTRQPVLNVGDSGQGWKGRWSTNEKQDPSDAVSYTFSPAGNNVIATHSTVETRTIAIPADMWFDDNPDVFVTIGGVDVADQISNAEWTREELVMF